MTNTAKIAVSQVTYWVDRPYSYTVPPALSERVRPGMRVLVPFGGNRLREGIVLALGDEDGRKLKPVRELLDEEPLLTDAQLKLALWMRERFFCTVMEAVRAMLPAGLLYNISSTYAIAEGVDREAAYAAAGKSKNETLVVDCMFAHGGGCPLYDIQAVFGTKNPGPALLSLERKGVLRTDAEKNRRGSDKTVLKASLLLPADEALARLQANAVRQASVVRLLGEIGKAPVSEICYFTGAGQDTLKKLEEKGLVTLSREATYRRPDYETGVRDTPMPDLSAEQREAFEALLTLALYGQAGAALLQGVTGSGKTTVYIHLIDEIRKRGKSSILLVPEIALTPQMLKTFSAHFGDEIAVLHSSLSMGERYDEWKRVRAGEARVIIGTRSAVFAPAKDLGIIIIDEEQEDTYKSENAPRYHARDVAKYLCAKAGALLLLGSATPDVVTRYSAQRGKTAYFRLNSRYNAMDLPRVSVVDMKRELKAGNGGSISSFLRRELRENIGRGEQSILFINRRGSNKLVTCGECGYIYRCPNCSASLTYHSVGNKLLCHYCGHWQRPGAACPECGGKLSFIGAGTQKVVEELNELFPATPILRMDTDAVAPAGSHRTLLEEFKTRKIPIMVGTQMVTKGLNFENVTLVGVLSADQSLYCGDYRAGERTFSLITQVIGRSGRFEKPGRAVIQTFTPENQVIRQAAMQDYDSFYTSEIELRRVTGSPPFSDQFVLTASGEDEDAVLRCCADIRALMLRETASLPEARVLGPAPLPIAKVNNAWRYRVTVSAPSSSAIRRAVGAALITCNNDKLYRGVAVFADFNPLT